jgi:predicted O-methyltransferase YrrM
MKPTIQNVLKRIELDGLQHDQSETDHARKRLNLEPETGAALAILLKIANVHRLLEIGTSTGYSTICIASVLEERGGRVMTVERDPQKQAQARLNVAEAGLSAFVDWSLGEATEIVAALPGPYDCVFFDADRVSAPAQLDLLLPKLVHPVLLLADNAISHADQICNYLALVNQLPGVSHVIIPVGKGLSVAHLP